MTMSWQLRACTALASRKLQLRMLRPRKLEPRKLQPIVNLNFDRVKCLRSLQEALELHAF